MNVVDSSAWLEYFAGGANADQFAKIIENPEQLIVPTLSIYEVFKKVLQQRSEHEALQAVAAMQQGKVVEMDTRIAIEAARISNEHQLPLADSVILATAKQYEAILWTQDAHFEGMEGVEYRKSIRKSIK
jgi:predicted nucleic acid-binding protein